MNPELKPTLSQTFELVGRGLWDFAAALDRSYRLQDEGRIGEACDERYAAVRRLIDFLPEDETVVLEWAHRNSRAALETVHASAVDHFLAGDFELSAALCELLLDLDPEDHTECVSLLGWCYVAMEEYELFDEIANDIPDSLPEKHLLLLWSEFRQSGRLAEGELRILGDRFGACREEFRREEHPVDEEYLAGLSREPQSRQSLARQLWLQTEHLWAAHPDFIEALRRA